MMAETSMEDMEATVRLQAAGFSTMNLNESWVELGTGESNMVRYIHILPFVSKPHLPPRHHLIGDYREDHGKLC